MLEKLFLFFKGYLILELCGESQERFINLCKNKEIEIIHIFSVNQHLFCKIHCRDYVKLRQLVKKTHCYPIIKNKRGFPFLLRQLSRRKGLLIGSVIFFLIITQCSKRIWNIEVEGGFLHTRQQIMRVLEDELGIYGGVPGNLIDCFEIEKRLRLDYSEIGWISVEKKGCRLSVMMNESVMPEIVEGKGEPCHIVAERDGIVKKIEVISGVSKVKVGDTVKKGDILISGVVPIVGDYDTLIRNDPVCAKGAIYLETEFDYTASYAMEYERKKFTEEKNGLALFLFEKKLFSYIPRYSEGKYDIITVDIVPYVFEDYQAPVILRKYRSIQYETEKIRMTESEAKEKAKTLWEAFLKDWEDQGVHVVKASFSTEIRRNICTATGTVTACGNFISYQKIMEEEWIIENEHSGNNP